MPKIHDLPTSSRKTYDNIWDLLDPQSCEKQGAEEYAEQGANVGAEEYAEQGAKQKQGAKEYAEQGANVGAEQGANVGAEYKIFCIRIGKTQRGKILQYLLTSAEKNNLESTPPLTLGGISQYLQINKHTVKSNIARLKKEGSIVVNESIKNRSGYTRYGFSDAIKKIYHYGLKKQGAKEYAEQGANGALLVSSLVNNKLTNGKEDFFEEEETSLPSPWASLKIQDLEDSGLTQGHIWQIIRSYEKQPEIALDVSIIQDSLDAFLFDLRHNDIKKRFHRSPIAGLVGLLKRGNPYTSLTPESFLKPRADALNSFLQMKEQEHAQRKQVEEKVQTLSFEEWRDGLDPRRYEPYISDTFAVTIRHYQKRNDLEMVKRFTQSALRNHFNHNVWPQIRKTVLSSEIFLASTKEKKDSG